MEFEVFGSDNTDIFEDHIKNRAVDGFEIVNCTAVSDGNGTITFIAFLQKK